MTAPFLSIVIPAYNEENRLPKSLEKVFAFLQTQPYTSEVIVVENGSSDQTLITAQEIAKQHPNLTVIHENTRGKGNAVKTGMLRAKGSYRFICDADLSMPIEEIQKFIPPALNNIEVAIASREAKESIRFNEPSYRHFGGRFVNFIIRILILPGLHDTQCGFKCFSDRAAEKLFSQQTLEGWAFDIEVLYLARKNGIHIVEVPINWYFDADSKVNAASDAIKMIADIFRIRMNSMRGIYDTTP